MTKYHGTAQCWEGTTTRKERLHRGTGPGTLGC